MRSHQEERGGGGDGACLSVQDAAVVLCEDVGGALYFLHVPDQRRKRDKKSGKRFSHVASYDAVARALRERGILMTNAQVHHLRRNSFSSCFPTNVPSARLGP